MFEKSASGLDRRRFLILGAGAGLAALVPLKVFATSSDQERFTVTMSDEQWKEKLTPEQYRVLREEGTERAFTSPLNDEHRHGVFKCAGCGQELFSSEAKFDSGTGWPSFFQPIEKDAVGTTTDYKLVYPRTEVHCAKCGGHLGHRFDDGPNPTGQRYCMNGVAMQFKPEDSKG